MTNQSERYKQQTEQPSGRLADQVADKAREIGDEALDRADELLRPVGLSIRERPMTCLAVVGGLAFAAGALWKLGSSREQSRYDELAETLSGLVRRARWR